MAGTPKHLLITGGTDGIGRWLADRYLARGERVTVVGRDPAKGESFLAAARAAGGGDRARFLPADLALLAENRRVVAEITATHPVLDALVLCARYYRSRRTETAEGLEENLALFYLGRHLLSHGLAGPLSAAERPVVVNVAGPGGPLSLIHWDDLGLARGYDGNAALFQGGKLNDLLGVTFAERHGAGPVRYVLWHPGSTATGLTGEYDPPTAAFVAEMRRAAKPVQAAAAPIAAVIDAPPAEPLSAFVEGRRLDTGHPSFDPAAARRLEALTAQLLER